MKSLEQVFGKIKQPHYTPPPHYPSRTMLLTSKAGNFRLTWKLKFDHWFLCEGSEGWYQEFKEVMTEAAFRQWLKHNLDAVFICETDNHPPFRNLISPIQRTTTFPPRSDGNRSLNRVHAQARPL